MIFKLKISSVLMLVGVSISAQATDLLNVGYLHICAQVEAKCTATAQNINFGTVDPSTGDVPLQTPGKITIVCSGLANHAYTVNVGLNGGLNPGPHRQMIDATNDLLLYDLYIDANFTQPWGDIHTLYDTQVSLQFTNSNNKEIGSHLIYGKIFQNNSAIAGTYNDTVGIDLSF